VKRPKALSNAEPTMSEIRDRKKELGRREPSAEAD